MAALYISRSNGIICKYMPDAFKSIFYIYSILCLTVCLERRGGIFNDLWSDPPTYKGSLFTSMILRCMRKFEFSTLLYICCHCNYEFSCLYSYRDWCYKLELQVHFYELDKHVQNVKKGWIPTYYKPFAVTDHAVCIFYILYLAWWWLYGTVKTCNIYIFVVFLINVLCWLKYTFTWYCVC